MTTDSAGHLGRRYNVRARSRMMRDIHIGAALLRDEGPRKVLSHAWGVGLWRLHTALSDRYAYAGLPQASLRERVVQDCELKVSRPEEIDAAEVCKSTPARPIEWMLDGLNIDVSRHSFIDIGSGVGVAVLRAARRPFVKAIGVEFAREVHEAALENLEWARQHWPIAAGEIELRNESALETAFPDTPCVVFMFNPFRGQVMRDFVAHLLADHARNPRPMTILYGNPPEETLFRHPPFEPVRLKSRQRLLLGALCPVPVRVFRLG